MENYIETPKMSEILSEEFMLPFGLSAYRLAQEIHVPVSRIQDILHDRRKITADTSIRLGKFFGVSERYFLDMQDDIDIRNTKMQIMEQLPTHKDIPLFGRTILEQQCLLLETLEKWEENFEKELAKERKEK